MAKQIVQLNFLRMAPRKVRAVAGLIRGASVNDAEAQLLYERRRAAKPLLKLLRSAVAAARQTKKLNPDMLIIETVTVDGGPMLKRSLPRARGMATPIQKKMSHVTLTLAESSAPRTSRFSIVIRKKAKKPEGDDRPRKRRKASAAPAGPEKDHESAAKVSENPGFFKRVFRRKAV